MLSRILAVLVVVALVQLILVWVLSHAAVLLLGVCGWWLWSSWEGRSRA